MEENLYKYIFLSLITLTSCAKRRQIAFNYDRLEEIDRCSSANCAEEQENKNKDLLPTILTPGDSISSSVGTYLLRLAAIIGNWTQFLLI